MPQLLLNITTLAIEVTLTGTFLLVVEGTFSSKLTTGRGRGM